MLRTMRNRRFRVSPTSKVTSGRAVVFFAANPMAAGMTQAATSKGVVWPLQVRGPADSKPDGVRVDFARRCAGAGDHPAESNSSTARSRRHLRRWSVAALRFRSLASLGDGFNQPSPGLAQPRAPERLQIDSLEPAAIPLHLVSLDLLSDDEVRLSSGSALVRWVGRAIGLDVSKPPKPASEPTPQQPLTPTWPFMDDFHRSPDAKVDAGCCNAPARSPANELVSSTPASHSFSGTDPKRHSLDAGSPACEPGPSWLAGASRMPWHAFSVWNAAGAISWAPTLSIVAYYAGHSTAGSAVRGCRPHRRPRRARRADRPPPTPTARHPSTGAGRNWRGGRCPTGRPRVRIRDAPLDDPARPQSEICPRADDQPACSSGRGRSP